MRTLRGSGSSDAGPVTIMDVAVQMAPVADENDNYLYILLPYFNYCAYAQRKKLFYEFVERIKDEPGIRIVVSEAILVTEPEEHQKAQALLPMCGVWKHLRYTTKNALWIKENCLNLAVKQLPESWKYVAWVDADLVFYNKSWVADTIESLKKYDISQMFFKCDFLGPNNEVLKEDTSFGYLHVESKAEPYWPGKKYAKFRHPGYCFAYTRKAYVQMKGFPDWCILGSADHHMALALIGKVNCSHPNDIHPIYKQKLLDFEARCKGLTLGYVPMRIGHMWHGSANSRVYTARWFILTENKYDPSEDITKNEFGLVQLTEEGSRLERPLRVYFSVRKEDYGTTVTAPENYDKTDFKKLFTQMKII